jgi:Domain of unknown function (DUF3870)
VGTQVIVTGYAKMPEGTAARRLYEQLTLGALVDIETHTVVRATSTLVTDVGRDWVEDVLTGVELFSGYDEFIARVQAEYWGQAQSAIVQCFRDLVRRYEQGLARRGLAGAEHLPNAPSPATPTHR